MRRHEEQRMKRENGFSLVELLVAMVILIAITSAAVAALVQAQNTTNSIAQEANTQENLRAGMHFLVRDLMQAGEGIPAGGISIPSTAAGNSAIIRPGIGGVFPNNPTAFSVVVPGSGWGADATTVNAQTGAVLVGGPTDTITIFYADNSLLSSANCTATGAPCPLNNAPVTSAVAPVCTGTIAATGLTVTLAPGCFTLPGTPTPIQQGDLILFQNINGTALELVTNVNVGGNILTFAAGDPAGLNGTGQPNGTVAAIAASAVPTVITRVWMITYYINTATNPAQPQLIRQVNYPGYPAAAATYPPQQVADATEWLNFTYDIISTNDPVGTYPNGPGDAPTPQAPDTSFQIRAVNVLLGGRSEYPLVSGSSRQYFRNNLSTQVSIRSLAFVNQFNVSATAPD
jgi:prepilin-type N-terminal cleavage/methylation domain-containing protein